MNWIKSNFSAWDREKLFSQIEKIKILKVGNTVVTKWGDRVVSTREVSNKYEIFDISSFMREKILEIEQNFTISFYRLQIRGGVQSLTLLSDPVEVGGSIWNKSFYILSSSDKSRALQLNIGLQSQDSNKQIVFSDRNFSLYKKHLTGVTRAADKVSASLVSETFLDQISAINSLVGQRVMISNIRRILCEKDNQSDHKKFDAFKKVLIFGRRILKDLTPEQKQVLYTQSKDIVFTRENDFSLDAFDIFTLYLQIFSNEDSHVIKKEAQKIMRITTCFIRNEKLDFLLQTT
jgi:hypothetical protein